MKKTIGLVLSALFFLSACTSGSKNTSVANNGVVSRAPSSIEDFEVSDDPAVVKDMRSITAAFSLSGSSAYKKAEADIKRRMSQILKRSSAAAALMNDFDKELETYFDANGNLIAGKTFDLQASKTYSKLQHTRDLVESVEHHLISVYAHLWKLYISPAKAGVPSHRATRVQGRAKDMLAVVHSEVSSYLSDVRVIGLIRLKPQIEELSLSMANDIRSGDKSFADLAALLAKLDASENAISAVTYTEFIDLMKSVKDPDYDREMKTREPQSNVVVEGFKNTTGSDFGANKWVLTFDDGPHKDNTLYIAKLLKDEGVKGDFFWLSKLVKTYPSIAKSIYDDGFGIASHSIDHSNLPKLSAAKIKDQVSGSRDVIEKQLHDKGATGYRMKDFRCPYGACWAPKSKAVQQAIKDAGLRHVYWTVDTMDWQDKNTQSVLARTLKQMKAAGRGVILFHDIHPVAGNVLPLLFKDKYVKDNNIQFLGL